MDAYDRAIKFFQDNPDQILVVWDDPKSHWAGVLFQSVTPTGAPDQRDDMLCGDICEICSQDAVAWTDLLTAEIVKDSRIPKLNREKEYVPDITIESLGVFAEWQRKIDVVLRRSPDSFAVEN